MMTMKLMKPMMTTITIKATMIVLTNDFIDLENVNGADPIKHFSQLVPY